nr:MAG TPA: Splicing factor SF3a60 binding domain [Caudoviricetes sp.]
MGGLTALLHQKRVVVWTEYYRKLTNLKLYDILQIQ